MIYDLVLLSFFFSFPLFLYFYLFIYFLLTGILDETFHGKNEGKEGRGDPGNALIGTVRPANETKNLLAFYLFFFHKGVLIIFIFIFFYFYFLFPFVLTDYS